jgi:hypothetical protein
LKTIDNCARHARQVISSADESGALDWLFPPPSDVRQKPQLAESFLSLSSRPNASNHHCGDYPRRA